MKKNESHESGLERLVEVFEKTQIAIQTQAARSVDIALVVRNWLFGWYISEFEKHSNYRKEVYGKALMPKLSRRLTDTLGKGFSRRSLDQFRQFYECYKKIWQTLSAKSQEQSQMFMNNILSVNNDLNRNKLLKINEYISDITNIWQILSAEFCLSWSHYVVLMSIKSLEERRFYEIEARDNSWGIRELKRQISSSL